MKKLIFALVIFLGSSVAVSAQTTTKKDKEAPQKTEMTKHVCTDACTNGNHVYAHDEKGQVCTDACKKAMTGKSITAKAEMPALKDHVCTAACKDGKHVYAHGEKGHVCTDACKKM
ncbi:MAG: hypothetical protein GZ091_03540 [Paludibacter sp.]|nr:hypothetical protein [Paludibacter sp.]